jgi:hypothetical protein
MSRNDKHGLPSKTFAHGDLETVIKMTRQGEDDRYDPTKNTYPSSEYIWPDGRARNYHGAALPEAFFNDDHFNQRQSDGNDSRLLFENMGDTVDAMRSIIRSLPDGEGLSRATRAYFGLQWKQFTIWRTWGIAMQASLRKPERFVVDRRETSRDAWKRDAFYCYETLFFRMCEAAAQLGRGKYIEEALPRPRLLLEAVILSGGCVEGLKKVAVKLDDHDYKTTHAKLKTIMKPGEGMSGFRGAKSPQEGAVGDLMSGVNGVCSMMTKQPLKK